MIIKKNNAKKQIISCLLAVIIAFTTILSVNIFANGDTSLEYSPAQSITKDNLVFKTPSLSNPLGGAVDFNGMIFGNFKNFADSEGPVALSGETNVNSIGFTVDATYLSHQGAWFKTDAMDSGKAPYMSVGLLLGASAKTTASNTSIPTGDVVCSNDTTQFKGSVYGAQGFGVYVRDTADTFMSDALAKLKASNQALYSATDHKGSIIRYTQGGDNTAYTNAGYPLNDTIRNFNITVFKGTNTDYNIIDLDLGTSGISGDDIIIYDFPENSNIYFNISNSTVDKTNGTIKLVSGSNAWLTSYGGKTFQSTLPLFKSGNTYRDATASDCGRILMNIDPNFTGTVESRSGANYLMGSLLAPNADFSALNGDSSINGNLVCKNASGNGGSELHWFRFTGHTGTPDDPNVVETGSIKINKTVVSDTNKVGTFYFKITNANDEQVGNIVSITTDSNGKGNTTINDFPIGNYTVTEVANASGTTLTNNKVSVSNITYTVTGNGIATVVKDTVSTVSFTNTEDAVVPPATATGSIKINKTVVSDTNKVGTFYFKIKDSQNNQVGNIVSITTDSNGKGNTTINDFPIGNYTVTEVADSTGTIISNNQFTLNSIIYNVTNNNAQTSVQDGNTSEVTITNTEYIPSGKITINKTVSSENHKVGTFYFKIKDSQNEQVGNIVSITTDSNGKGSTTINDLPIGNYTVTEVADSTGTVLTDKKVTSNSITYTAYKESISVTVTDKQSVSAQFTNTEDIPTPPVVQKGNLTINKLVNSSNGHNVGTFYFKIKDSQNNQVGNIVSITTNANGTGSVTINDLPIGTYNVTEVANASGSALTDSKVTVSNITYNVTGSNATIIENGQTSTLTFTNTELTHSIVSRVDGENGTITEKDTTIGGIEVDKGTHTYTITPDTGYKVKTLTLDGKDVKAEIINGVYTFNDICADQDALTEKTHEVIVSFEKITHSIVSRVEGGNGTITEKDTTIDGIEIDNGIHEYTITHNAGYKVKKLTLDGKDVTADIKNGVYTFNDICADQDALTEKTHEVIVSFEKIETPVPPTDPSQPTDPIPPTEPSDITHSIEAKVEGGHGTITEGVGEIEIGKGNHTFNITPDDGYHIKKITIDGIDVTNLVDKNGHLVFADTCTELNAKTHHVVVSFAKNTILTNIPLTAQNASTYIYIILAIALLSGSVLVINKQKKNNSK